MLRNYAEVEKRWWDVGDELRANSKVKRSESSVAIPQLTFFCYAEQGEDRSREFAVKDATLFTLTRRQVKV